jgi:uncharacterized protein YlxW (UPF0749 family)
VEGIKKDNERLEKAKVELLDLEKKLSKLKDEVGGLEKKVAQYDQKDKESKRLAEEAYSLYKKIKR